MSSWPIAMPWLFFLLVVLGFVTYANRDLLMEMIDIGPEPPYTGKTIRLSEEPPTDEDTTS